MSHSERDDRRRRIAGDHTPDYPVGDPVAPSVVGVVDEGLLAIGEQHNSRSYLWLDVDSDFAICNVQEHT